MATNVDGRSGGPGLNRFGLGAILPGLLLHWLLPWRHMGIRTGYPPDSMANLKRNMLGEGLLHMACRLMTHASPGLLWTGAPRRASSRPAGTLVGGIVLGRGLFNTVDGSVNPLLLCIHHANEPAPPDKAHLRDQGFLAIIAVGRALVRGARSGSASS